MSTFLEIVTSFPTVLFTAMLGVAMAYWLFVLLGAIEVPGVEAGDGLVEGALEGVDGAIEGVEGALDGVERVVQAVDAGVDVAEGAVEGAVGAADATAINPLLWLAALLRVGRVPGTVSLTAFAFWGWFCGFVLTALLTRTPGVGHTLLASSLVLVASVLLAALSTNLSVRPFERLFVLHTARDRSSLIGEVCSVTTGRVDDRFGQANIHIGHDDLLIQVRCDKPNALRRTDHALIVSFDTERDAFIIEPMATARVERETVRHAGPLPDPSLANKEA